nr:SusC/RagA family TonB-linked outer membrane protein [Bacteroidales bacterium]
SKSFEGTTPGVQVTSGGGQPGEGASIRIRGTGSINASATPLFVVDGVPYDGALSSLNPSDIESMTVLKDASAGALYGARGANGVIMITTKKGTKDKSTISYKGMVGISSRALKNYDLLNMKEYVEITYEALRNAAQYGTGMDYNAANEYAAASLGEQIGGLLSPEYYNPYKNYTWETLIDPSTGKMHSDAVAKWDENWVDAITKNAAVRTEHSLSIRSGSEKSTNMVSFGYYDEDGILTSTDFTRYTGRVSSEIQGNDWLKASVNANFSHTDADYQSSTGSTTSNSWYTAQFMAPVYPVYLKDLDGNNVLASDGSLQYEYGSIDDNGYANRPTAQGFNSLAELKNNRSYYQRNALSARSSLVLGTTVKDAKFYGLKLTVNIGTDFSDYGRTIAYDKYHGNAATVGGRLQKTNTRTWSYTINELLTYDKKFGDFHMNLLAGHEFYRYRYNYALQEKTGTVDGVDELSPAVTTSDNDSYTNNYAIESYLSRMNLSYMDRYYFDASWRTDASSRFYKDNRWGNFWSVGGSWRVSQEKFMKNIKSWLSNLTYKISYGIQGNDDIGSYYAWQGLYNYTWANGSEAGAFASKLENTAITWEKNANLNTGIDASLFGGKVAVTAEYYNRKTKDMLLDSPMAMSTGFKSFDANVGTMRNQGAELSVRSVLYDRENFFWDVTVMGAFNRNKVLSLTSGQDQIVSGTTVIEVGKPIHTFYMAKTAGVDPSTGTQLYYAYYRQTINEDGDAVYSECDEYVTSNTTLATMSKYYFGSREPKLYGSLSTNFTLFKNLDLSIMTTYSLGGKIYDSLYSGSMKVSGAGRNWHRNILRRWQEPGQITDIPRVEIGGSYSATNNYLINASYFSIKNITVGYTIPSALLKKLDIESLRLFATLDNIALFSHLDGMDPQYSFTGSTSYTYTPTRVISAGIDLKF